MPAYRRNSGSRRAADGPSWLGWVIVGILSAIFLASEFNGFALWPSAKADILGRASGVDGDTIEMRGERIRLHGIDAPESGQSCLDAKDKRYRCGQRAALDLADKIKAANVRCDVLDRDDYGRHVATCFLGQLDPNDWMVRQGYAIAYRR